VSAREDVDDDATARGASGARALGTRDKISAPRAWSPDDSVAVIAAQPA
jgi:hypothetical protein